MPIDVADEPPMDDHEPDSPNSGMGQSLRKTLSNPWVGAIGTITTILALLLSVYFYFAAEKRRQLIVASDPPVELMKSGQASTIDIVYQGKKLTTDVYVRQLYIWNAGRESIHAAHVLEPIAIDLGTASPILEARIRKGGRPVTNVRLDTAKIQGGLLYINWRLLEENDGAAIDIIYTGNRASQLAVRGVVEEQRTIATREYPKSSNSLRAAPTFYSIMWVTMILVIGGMGYWFRELLFAPSPSDRRLSPSERRLADLDARTNVLRRSYGTAPHSIFKRTNRRKRFRLTVLIVLAYTLVLLQLGFMVYVTYTDLVLNAAPPVF